MKFKFKLADGTEQEVDLTEQFQEALTPIVAQLSTDVNEFLTATVKPLSEKLDSLTSTTAPKATEGKPGTEGTDSTYEARLKTLETQLQERDKAIEAQRLASEDQEFQSHLSESLDSFGPKNKKEIQGFLYQQLKGSVEKKPEGWMTKDGKTVSESLKGFFATDFGKHQLPSQHVDGAGSTPASETAKTPAKTTASDIAAAFS